MKYELVQPSQAEVINLAECPRCGARAGQPCNRKGDVTKKRSPGSHVERLRAARTEASKLRRSRGGSG